MPLKSSAFGLLNREISNKTETSIIVLTQSSLVDLFHSSGCVTTSDGCVVTSVLKIHKENDTNTSNNKNLINYTNQFGEGKSSLIGPSIMFNSTKINSNFEGNKRLSVPNTTTIAGTASNSATVESNTGQKSIIMALNGSQQVGY